MKAHAEASAMVRTRYHIGHQPVLYSLTCVLLILLIASAPCIAPAQPTANQQTQGGDTERPTSMDPRPESNAEQPVPVSARAPADGALSGTPARGHELSLLGRSALLIEDAPSPQARHFQKDWQALLARHNATAAFAPTTTLLPGPVLAQWKAVISRMPAMKADEKLRTINGFFNNWSSEPDIKNYGQEEYWASPEEFLTKGGGDCEDYAIIKYLALRYFSWPAQDIWIVFVDDRINKGKHAVLAARMNDKIFILDNLSRPAYLLIPEKQYAGQVTPLYALNEQGVWIFPGAEDVANNKEKEVPEADKKSKDRKVGQSGK